MAELGGSLRLGPGLRADACLRQPLRALALEGLFALLTGQLGLEKARNTAGLRGHIARLRGFS